MYAAAVGSRIEHSSKHGKEKVKQNLAEIFRPPHDLLFNGTFHEVLVWRVCVEVGGFLAELIQQSGTSP